MTDAEREGLVVASFGQRGMLSPAPISHQARPNDNTQPVPFILKGRKLRAVCGDRVIWHLSADGDAVVSEVLTRQNALERPDSRGHPETIAANLTHIVVVLAPVPEADFFIADRYLCAAEILRAKAVVVWNKADLQPEPPSELGIYATLGYPVVNCSTETGTGIDELESHLSTGVAMLVGQSGVGKSSLINKMIPNAEMATGELSSANREGKHTTTASFMHRFRSGGRLIDSPGVRDFAPAIRDVTDVAFGFVEINSTSKQCRFADCQHLREPNCAVKDAVAAGSINERRYESYKRLRNSTLQLREKMGFR